MKYKQKVLVLLSLTMAMSLVPVHTSIFGGTKVVTAASNTKVSAPKLQKVKLTSTAYIECNEVQFYHVDGDKYVFFDVTVKNEGKNTLNLIDYWFSIKSNTGEKYSVQLLDLKDKKDNLIPSNTSKTFKIYTKVNSKLNLYNLSLDVIKWDFSVPGFERGIGSIKVPASYSNAANVGQDHKINQGERTLVTTASALQLVDSADNTEAMVSLYIKNTGNSAAQVDAFQYYLRTSTNKYYSLEPEQKELSVAPGEKIKVNFYAKLPSKLPKQDYQLFIAEEVGTDTKIKTPVAYYKLMLRELKNTITQQGQPYTLYQDNQPIETKITNTYVDSNAEYHNITITYQLMNKGKKAVPFPKYIYELVTSNQQAYPFSNPETTGELLPGISQELTMTTSVPASTDVDNLKLIIKRMSDEGKNNNYLLARYMIPNSNVITEGTTSRYVNKQGAYEITIENFQRLPLDTQDLINARLTVKNIGTSTQPIPKLSPSVWLNGLKVNSDDIKLLAVEDEVALKQGETAEYIITSKVSSQSKFDTARVQLSEIIQEKPVNTVANFTIKTEDAELPTFAIGSTANYTMKQPGVTAEMKILESDLYKGDRRNVISALVLYRNSGDRYAALPAVKAFYKTNTGVIIPAKVTLSDKELAPEDANLISFTAEVPKQFTKEDLQLVVGQGIKEGKYATGAASADSYVNAAILEMGNTSEKVKTLFESVELRPYTFRINEAYSRKDDSNSARFYFNYNLSEYAPFREVLVNKSIVFEIEYNGKKFEKVYKLNGEGLQLGEKIDESFVINDPAMSGVGLSGFRLNVYEEVEGARKHLIEHSVGYFGFEK